MAGTTMVFLIATISIVFGVIHGMFNRFMNYKKSHSVSNEQADLLQKEIAKLKERVIVLEQLVTDESYQVKQKFKNL